MKTTKRSLNQQTGFRTLDNSSVNNKMMTHWPFSQKKAKKLVIKNFQGVRELPNSFENDSWTKLHEAVLAIQQKRAVPFSLEELYKSCEQCCQHKLGNSLYVKLRMACELYAQGLSKPLLDISDIHLFLCSLRSLWLDYCEQMLMIRSIFLFLDRTFVLQSENCLSIWDLGLHLLRQCVMDHHIIQQRTRSGLLESIEQERKGNSIDVTLIKDILKMLRDLNLYGECFEPFFLSGSKDYHSTISAIALASLDTRKYLEQASIQIELEHSRAERYLAHSTRRALENVVEKEWIETYSSSLVQNGLENLLSNHDIQHLSLMYSLLERVNQLDRLKQGLGDFIKEKGKAIIMTESNDANMVSLVLELKDMIDSVMEGSFERNENFNQYIKDSFESFINQRANKTAEMIAKFVDIIMRSNQLDDIETRLDKVLVMFRYIQGKDVFEAFYKSYLSKRLLLGKSASIDVEKAMLLRLKAECGSGFTSKLEGMFKDMELSKEINLTYKQSKYNIHSSDMDMSVSVLTSTFWPTIPPVIVSLPKAMIACQDSFKSFYLAKHQGRRLTWHHAQSTCVIRADFTGGRKELYVSLVQAVILLLFNNHDILTFEQIKSLAGLEDREAERQCFSLCTGKVIVLIKSPEGKTISPADEFRVNMNFRSKHFRLKINTIQFKETPEEQTATTETVFQNRQFQIDAALVRIMKARKTLSHNLLVSELFAMIQFPAKTVDLKKRIESLIDKEFIRRDDRDQSLYHYVA